MRNAGISEQFQPKECFIRFFEYNPESGDEIRSRTGSGHGAIVRGYRGCRTQQLPADNPGFLARWQRPAETNYKQSEPLCAILHLLRVGCRGHRQSEICNLHSQIYRRRIHMTVIVVTSLLPTILYFPWSTMLIASV